MYETNYEEYTYIYIATYLSKNIRIYVRLSVDKMEKHKFSQRISTYDVVYKAVLFSFKKGSKNGLFSSSVSRRTFSSFSFN